MQLADNNKWVLLLDGTYLPHHDLQVRSSYVAANAVVKLWMYLLVCFTSLDSWTV